MLLVLQGLLEVQQEQQERLVQEEKVVEVLGQILYWVSYKFGKILRIQKYESYI